MNASTRAKRARPATRGGRTLERAATPARGRRRLLWWAKALALAALVCAALGAATLAAMFWYYGRDDRLPNIGKLADYRPLQVARVVTADGTVIGEIFQERRTFVPLEDVPEHVIHAFVSAEDASFFEHGGIDYVGMLRAVFVNLKSGQKRQGASTITQQVVKTFLLSPERTFRRKFQEIILARRLESALSKDDILTLYLNQIYFGHGRYGVAEAARYYFGKSVGELNVGEAAVLAGLPKAPERLSPRKPGNAGRAKARQTYVLEQMVKNGYLDAAEAKRWIDAPIEIVDDAFPHLGEAPEWVDIARRELVARFGEDDLYRVGGTVVVTVDLDVQRAARDALRAGLREVDARQGFGRPIKRVKPDQIDLEVAKLARRLRKRTPRRGERYRAVVRDVRDATGDAPARMIVDLGDWRALVELPPRDRDDRYNPEHKRATERFRPGDVVRVVPIEAGDGLPAGVAGRAELARGPEGAVVAIDPRTRQVLAVVGGYDPSVGDFNRATMAHRQAGSTFKPFVYAAAIASRDFTPATIAVDAPEVYEDWVPENYKKGEFEGPVRLRYALAKSINSVSVRLIRQIGPARVAELANALGVETKLEPHRSLALGAAEVTPLELTNAFATFAAGGVAAPPQFVSQVAGERVPPPEPRQVLDPAVAYVMIDMLRSVVTEGTGGRARALHLDVAGKTGTTNDAKDAWFIGLTPALAVGVWIGFDEPRSLGRKESGGHTAVPVFVHMMERLGKRVRGRRFEPPPGVVTARVDKATGLLAPPGATDDTSYVETFLDGTVPVEVAPSPGQVGVDDFVLEQFGDAAGGDAADSGAPTPTPP